MKFEFFENQLLMSDICEILTKSISTLNYLAKLKFEL